MQKSPSSPGHAAAWLSLCVATQLAAQAPYPCTWAGGNGGDWVSPQWAPQPLDFILESGIPIPLITWPDNDRPVGSGDFIYIPTIGDGRVNLNSVITISAFAVNSGAETRIRGGTLRIEGYSGYTGSAIANDGLISLGDSATLTAASAVFLPSGLTIEGGGTISLLDEGSAIKGNLLDFGSSQLVRGAGQVGATFGVGETPSSVVNRGTVLADAPPLAMTIQGSDYENKGTTRAIGGGLLKFRSLATDNQQLIEADAGVADFQDHPVENSGTLRAKSGGILQFKNQTVANGGGLIEAVGVGSLVQLRGDVTLESGTLRRTNRTTITLQTGTNTFTGGLLVQGRIEIEPTAGLRLRSLSMTGEPGTILNPQPGAVIYSDASVELRGQFDGNGLWSFNAPLSLTGPLVLNALQFDVGAGQPVNLSGTVTNNSVIRLLDGAGVPDTRLVATDGSILAGTGQIRFVTPQTNRVTPAATGAVLTNAAPHLLTTEPGGSAIFTATFVNAGTTEAAGAASLLQFQHPALTNTGLLQARDGGSLRFNSLSSGGTANYVITNTGGTIRLGAGSSGSFEQNVLLRGGTIDGPGTLNTSGFTVFDSLPANPIAITDTTVVLNEFQPFTLRGNLTNSGTFYFNDGTIIAPGGQQGSAGITLDGDVAIGGSGRLLFATQYSNLINAVGATTPTLTLGPAQTVTNLPGARGLIYPPTVNQGLIEAVGPNPVGFPNIELLSPSLTNTGTIGVRDNGVLFFNANNLIIQNTGGTLRANSGGYIDFRGTPTVVGGQFAGSGGTFLISNLTLDSATSPVTLNAPITIAPGQLTIRGALINNSLIQLAHPFSGGSVILIDAAVGATLVGSGRLNFGSFANNGVIDANGTNPVGLTNGPGHTITNTPGHLGLLNTAVFVNQGLVEAVGPNPPNQPNITINSASLTNSGVIASRDSGVLFFNAANVQNAGGILRVGNGASFAFNNGTTVHGGTLDGAGAFNVGSLTLNGTVTPVTNTTTINIGGYSGVTLRGNVVNHGEIALYGVVGPGGSAAQVGPHGPVTLSGTGRVIFANNLRNQIVDVGGTGALLTIAAGQTITTAPGAAGSFTASVLNQGLIESRGTGANVNFSPTALTNQGVIQTVDGGYLNFNLVAIANAGGFLRVGAGSTFQLSNNAVISGGTLDGDGAFYTSLITLDGSVTPVTNATTISMAPGQANLRGSILNQGTLAIGTGGLVRSTADGFTLGGSGALRFTGSNGQLSSHFTNLTAPMTLSPGATITTSPGGVGTVTGLNLTNQGVIEARGSGGILNFGPNSLINNGLVQSADQGSMNLTVLSVANAGGTLRVASGSGFTLTNSVVIHGGTLDGTGTFGIGIAVLDGSVSAVTVDNTLSLGASTTLYLRGSIVNNGLISLTPPSNGATVYITPEGATLGGTGSVRLGGVLSYFRAQGGSPAFTLAAGATITTAPGAGNAFIDTIAFTNFGLVEARGAGTNLTFNCNATNHSVLAAAAGATLTISGANNLVIENANGILRNEAGAAIVIGGGIDIRGGRLEGAGSVTATSARLNGSISTVVNATNLQVGSAGLTLRGTLQNDADVRSTVQGATLRLDGPVQLTGTGTLTFATANYAFWQGFVAGDAATLGAGQTMTTAPGAKGRLQGFPMTNNGVVEARGSGSILDVYNLPTVTNASLLRAADGGTLNLGAGLTYIVENAAGTLRSEGGSFLVAALVRGGRVESATGSEVRSVGAIFDGLANAVEITAGSTLRAAGLTLRGTINSAGTIYSANAGQSTIRIEGPVGLNGAGSMLLGPAQYTFLQGQAAADVLTLGSGHLITTQPAGLARAQGLSIISSGIIEARGASAIFDLWPERGFTNSGTVRAAQGGTMNLGAGVNYIVENANGVVRNEGGAVNLVALLRGGRIESVSGAEVRSTGAIVDGTSNAIEITAGSTLRSAGVTLRGTIHNAGNIYSANTGQSTIRIEGPVALNGSGTMTFGPAGYTFVQGAVAADALTIAADQTVTMQAGGQVRFQSLPLANFGLIEARGSGSRFDYYLSASTNSGVIRVIDSGVLFFGSGFSASTIENASGILRNDGGTFVLNARVRGGRLEGAFYVDPGNAVLDGSANPVVIAPGAQVYTPGGAIFVVGNIVNNGRLGLYRQSGGATLNISENFTLGGSGELEFGTAFNNALQQSVGGLTFTNGSTHTVRCTAGSAGNVSVSHYLNAGQTVADGTLTFSTTNFTNGPTGVLRGRGSIVTSPVLANQGKIAPGASAGALFISGSVTNAATAVFEAEIGGTVSGTEFDRLSVSGSFARGGALRPMLVNGFRPAPADSFLVLSAGSMSGAWANVVGGKVTFQQGTFDVVQTATTVTLTNFQINAAYAAYDAWVAGYPSLTGAAKDPGADPDGDGLTNLQEFAFGLNPTQAGGSLGLPRAFIDPVSGRLRIEFPRRKQTPPVFLNYELQYSSDLTSAWTIHPSGPVDTVDLDAVFELVTFEDLNGPPNYLQRFGRVRVELVP